MSGSGRVWGACRTWRSVVFAIVAACLPAFTAATAAPAYVAESWTVRDGLPVNSITQIVQARDGYLWLATFDGLVRFDGARFSVHNSSNTPGLRHSRLVHLRELPDGRLLLGSETGLLQVFDPQAGTARVLATLPGGLQPASWRAPDGDTWIALRPGLGRLRGEQIERVAGLDDLDVTALRFESDGSLLLGCGREDLWRWAGGTLERAYPFRLPRIGTLAALERDAQGQLWIGGSGGLARIDAAGASVVAVNGREHETIHALGLAASGLQIVAESGLHTWDGTALRPVDPMDFRRGPPQPDIGAFQVSASAVFAGARTLFRLADREATRISFALLDREGSLWLATSGAGLQRLRPATFATIGVAEGLSAREVYPLHQDAAGDVWIGTQKAGLNRWREGRLEHFGFAAGLADDNIRALASDAEGRLWVATHEASLFRADGAGHFAPAAPAELAPGVRIKALLAARDGTLWVGSDAGLHGRHADGRWVRHPASAALAGCSVRVIRQAPDAALWLGSDRCGSMRVAGDEVRRFDGSDGRLSDFVRDLLVVDAHTVWTASEDRGLARLRLRADGRADSVSVRSGNGLPVDGIHQVVDDGHGWWWMGSNAGVFRVRRAEIEALADDLARGAAAAPVAVEAYAEAAGLRNREVNGGHQDTAIRTADGRLWFATQDGVAVVDPDPARLARPVRAHIEAVHAGALRRVAGPALELAPEHRNLRVDYTELRQLDARQVQFRYRLAGYEQDWVQAGTRRSASYARLPAGDYRFEVQAFAGGEWNSPIATLDLLLRPHFHETTAFKALLALAAGALLALLYRIRVGWLVRQRAHLQREVAARTRDLAAARDSAEDSARTIAAQAQQLRELDHYKSRFFDDLAHELRTPLTLILGPLREAQRGGDAVPAMASAVRNGEVLLDLTNQLLDLARLREGKLGLALQRGDLADLLRACAERFAALAALRGVAFALRLPDAPAWALLDARHSGKMFDNLLSNAFKFTPSGGRVQLSLEAEGGGARVAVSDSGPGIPADRIARVFDRYFQADIAASARLQPGTGIGLALVRELAELHQGRVGVRSEAGAGACFEVWLPLAESCAARAQQEIELTRAQPLAEPVPAEAEGDEDRTTVLIVDDHPEILAQMRADLPREYRLFEATDGVAALALVRQHLPDLVIADVSMPGLDGYGLCAELRRDPEFEGLPVILLTARAGIEDRLEGLQAAADDYLTKPYDARELRARVANLLDLRRRLQRIFLAKSGEIRTNGAEQPGKPDKLEEPAGSVDAPGVTPWCAQLLATIDARMADEGFRVGDLAEAMGLDRTQLFRRVREDTGLAPSDLLRERRLLRAAQLLRGEGTSIGEVAYAVGFASVAYFTKCFRERFGCTPGQYRSDPQAARAA